MSFQAVGQEDLKDRGPKIVVQDCGASSVFASVERSRNEVSKSCLAFAEADPTS